MHRVVKQYMKYEEEKRKKGSGKFAFPILATVGMS